MSERISDNRPARRDESRSDKPVLHPAFGSSTSYRRALRQLCSPDPLGARARDKFQRGMKGEASAVRDFAASRRRGKFLTAAVRANPKVQAALSPERFPADAVLRRRGSLGRDHVVSRESVPASPT